MDLLAEFRNRNSPRTSLLRTKSGRVILPSLDQLSPDNMTVMFSDADFDAIMAEVVRRRRRWRIVAAMRVGFFVVFLVWTFFVMPMAAQHIWPFR